MKKIINLFIMSIIFISNIAYAQEKKDIFTYKVGRFEVTLLSEGQKSGSSSILIGATPEMLQKYVPDGVFPNAVNVFLVRTPEKTILVDAGYGSKLFDNLEVVGVNPKQVDIVLLTHMHGDHIGGLLRDGEVMFPKAEVYLSRPEHDYWTGENMTNQIAKDVVKAYKTHLHLFQPDAFDAAPTALIPGVQALAAYGHTPGHTAFLLESNNEKMLIWGDLTHAMAIQIPFSEVAVTYDVDSKKAVSSRIQTLKFVEKNNIPIAGMHIAFPGMGTITKKSGDGYIFIPEK